MRKVLADFWQTTLEFNQFIQREHDFSNRFGCVYGDRNDYALYEVLEDYVDTAADWGSDCDAPTISLGNPTER